MRTVEQDRTSSRPAAAPDVSRQRQPVFHRPLLADIPVLPPSTLHRHRKQARYDSRCACLPCPLPWPRSPCVHVLQATPMVSYPRKAWLRAPSGNNYQHILASSLLRCPSLCTAAALHVRVCTLLCVAMLHLLAMPHSVKRATQQAYRATKRDVVSRCFAIGCRVRAEVQRG